MSPNSTQTRRIAAFPSLAFILAGILATLPGCSPTPSGDQTSETPAPPAARTPAPAPAPPPPREESTEIANAKTPPPTNAKASPSTAKPTDESVDPGQPLVTLRPQPGRPFGFELSYQSKAEVTFGTTTSVKEVVTAVAGDVEFARPDKSDSEIAHEATLKFRNIRSEATQGADFLFDSKGGTNRGLKPEVALIIHEILQEPFEIQLNQNQDIVNLSAVDAEIAQIANRAKPQFRQNFRTYFENYFTGARIRQYVSPHRLPNRPPAEAASWTANYSLGLAGYGDLDLPATYTRTGTDSPPEVGTGKSAEASLFTFEFTSAFGPELGDEPYPLNPNTQLHSIDVAGTATLDLQKGIVTTNQATHQITLAIVTSLPQFGNPSGPVSVTNYTRISEIIHSRLATPDRE